MDSAAIGERSLTRRPLQRMPVRVMNAVGNGCSRLGLERIRLNAEGMCREAARRTGLSDFGDESFRPALEILVDSIQREAHLHIVARHLIRDQIIGRLGARLQMQAYWTKRPQVLERPLTRPLFILGLPRTGTTLLFLPAGTGSGTSMAVQLGGTQSVAVRFPAGSAPTPGGQVQSAAELAGA